MSTPVAQGQAIPPDVLRELQRQSGGAVPPQRRISPVDQARMGEQPAQQNADGRSSASPAEQKPKEMEVSALERDYRDRLASENLTQFGYDRLVGDAKSFGNEPVGRVSGRYVVGVGDEFAIVLRGAEQQDYITRVDSEGRLILDGLSPISAAGRTLDAISAEVANRVSETYVGTEVYVSLASLAQVSVSVVGEAVSPGLFQLDSQKTLLDALVAAGGVRKTGSLRQIRLVRSDATKLIDLYSLFRGTSDVDLNIRDGDRLVIPPIGATYAVTGEVLRPGIFELPSGVGGLAAQTAITVAGGSLRPRGYELIVNRLDKSGTENVQPVRLSGRLIAGDALSVVRTSNRAAGKLMLAGHVKAPGIRALATAPNIRRLLARSGGFLDQPYLPFAVLSRENPVSLNRQFEPVNLLNDGQDNLDKPLQSEDRLIVLGAGDVAFLSSNAVRQVVLSRQYDGQAPCAPLEQLASLGQDLQSERFAAVLRGAFVLEGAGRPKLADVGSLTDDGDAGQRAQGPEDQALCPQVYQEHPGLLPFTLEYASTIAGSVRQPAVIPVSGSVSLAHLVNFAGGLSYEASLGNVEIASTRTTDTGIQLDRSLFDLTKTPLESIVVTRGAAVTVQAIPSDQEPGTVLLSGEFQRPGVYTIRRGERLSSVIERAGGVSQRAYPYGAVFTRASVRRAQQQAVRRTQREMNTALATAALKNNVDAEALAAARELSEGMQTVETLGRVVVEADPRVLTQRADLDVVLEPGDRLFLPKRPNHVLAIGDVLNPGALQFVRGKTVAQYLSETGGIQTSADEKRIFLVYPNGVARPLPRRFWGSAREMVPPGSTIVVPKDIDPLANLQLTREITSILSQLAISAASFAVIFNNN